MYKSIIKFVPGPGLALTDLVIRSSYGNENFIFSYSNQTWEIYASDEEEKRLGKEGLQRFKTLKKFNQFKRKAMRIAQRNIRHWKQLDDLDLNKLSDRQLIKRIKLEEKNIIDYLNYYHRTEYYFFSEIDHLISNYISGLDQPERAREILNNLLTPLPQQNIFTKEQLARYQLILDSPNPDKSYHQLEKHLAKFDFLPFCDGARYMKLDDLKKQIKKDRENIEEVKKYISEQTEKTKFLIQKQTELDKQLPKDILELVKVVRAMQDFKYYLRICLNKSFFGESAVTTRLYREISRRKYYGINQLEFTTLSESIAIASGKKIETSIIKQRQESFICKKVQGKYCLWQGNEANEHISKIKPEIEDVDELKGSIANPGIAQGRAKLIRLTVKLDLVKNQIDEMKQGEILVTETTGPELIVACQKAAAIVTNEGGINSHAAIVSREIGIPCIIGTKIASDVIKNGDLIKIDANEGIVSILERS